MGEVVQFRLRTSWATAEPNRGVRLTEIEDLFFDVFWKQLDEHGAEAPLELGLPSGTRIVHRAIVGRAYRMSFAPADGSPPISENTIKSRWTRSTCRLRRYDVIGFAEPYFWWTGKPVLGKSGTQQHRPGGAA